MKKKGSSYIVVVMIMAVLILLATTMLTVTLVDYKDMLNSSKRLANLYGADSGLNVVEDIIEDTSLQAVEYAENQIISNGDNEAFKQYFIDFLQEQISDESKEDGSNTVIEYLIENLSYLSSYKDGSNWSISCTDAYDATDDKPSIEITGYSYDEENETITITVQSTFKSSSGQFENSKTISSDFIITAPDYNDSINSISIYPVFEGKVITADGNMYVSGETNIEGDIWIKGEEGDSTENPIYSFEKYDGGIEIEDGTLNLTGDLFTSKTLQLMNNAESTINGDVYALNVYVGKEDSSSISKNNSLDINGDLVVNNDLAMNSSNSSIYISGNFYGINDKTTDSITTAEKALTSSSIIVNNSDEDNTSLTIEGDSYIMGVAYIEATNDDGENYSTGESVAVKGNYLAYTTILEGYENEVTLEYYNPLLLVEYSDGDSIEEKAEYFKDYYEENADELSTAGVSLNGTVYSLGAYIKNGQVAYTGWDSSADSVISKERTEFATGVCYMGYVDSDSSSDSVYTADTEVKKTVENQINFNAISELGSNIETNDDYGLLILNSDDSKTITIGNGTIDGEKADTALIITNGDVYIEDGCDFTGNIITTGNIIFQGDGEKNLTYDATVTRNIIAVNYELLKNIFLGQSTAHEVIVNTSADSDYSSADIVETKNWKVVN